MREVNPWALFLGSWSNVERLGPYCLGIYVPEEHVAALWDAIHDGTVDVVGTDHAPHTRQEKEVGWQECGKPPGGAPVIQEYLQLFLDQVNRGVLSLDQVVRLTTYNPARIFGLLPRKGVITPGADADLVVVDLDKKETLNNQGTYTKDGWTPYDGQTLKGAPIMTLLRGQIVMADGKVTGGARRRPVRASPMTTFQ